MRKMTVKQVADKYGVTIGAVRRWIENGLVTEWDPGSPVRRHLITEDALENYFRSRGLSR
jgi:hypothetical protein